LPKQDANGMPANSFALPATLRPTVPGAVEPPSGAHIGKLATLVVSQAPWDGSGSASDKSSLVLGPLVRKEKGYEAHPLSIGETGTFPVSLQGNLGGQPLFGIGVGSLQVQEFSDLVFRGRFQGTVCRLKDMKSKTDCQRPVPVSGDIVKAFAGSRLPGHYLRIEDTPGVALYRRLAEQNMGMVARYNPASPSTNAGNASGAGSQGGSTGALSDCTCTCEERETANEAAERLKARRKAGEDIAIGEIMGLTLCVSQCQREYMVCEMEKAERERVAAKQSRAESPNACDCGCAGMEDLKREMANTQARFQSGQPFSLQAMERFGKCMNACQTEYAACLMR
jgi:hypothetical protein